MTPGTALIVGGGIGGMSAAIALRRGGWAVELIDLDPEWRVYGAGIAITGPTLRAFQQLGVLDEILAQGYSGEGVMVRSVDGKILSTVPTPVIAEGVPGTGGIMRPTLHRILSARVRTIGVTVRLGLTVDSLETDDAGVAVTFSDGSAGRFDLVVGADGVHSKVRRLILPDAPVPVYTGQACWRLRLPRHPDIQSRCYFLGGPVKVGLTPVSPDEMYMFLLETVPEKTRQDDAGLYRELGQLLDGYGGILKGVRDSLSPASQIVYRPLEAFLLPPPWFVGSVLLIGDAAHPTTPQLASGAGLAVEDAIVLAEELDAARDVADGMTRFMDRRWPRCRLVVENSIEIGRREQARRPVAEQTEIVERSLAALAEPI